MNKNNKINYIEQLTNTDFFKNYHIILIIKMETIAEIKIDKITKFLSDSGIPIGKDISMCELNSKIGKENNPFNSEIIEYDVLYEYVSSIKSNTSIISHLHEEKYVSNTHTSLYQRFLSGSYKAVIILLSLMMWLIYFFYHNDSIAFRIAKGFGLNLRIWSVVLPLLMCRTLLMGKFQKHSSYHKLIGYIYCICAVGHTMAHFINSQQMNGKHITGILLLIFVLIITITSYFRHTHYNVFLYCHRLSWLISPILIAHVPGLWLWFFIGILVLLIEHTFNFFMKLQFSSLINSRLSKYDNLLYLSFHRKNPSSSGAFYKIMIPSISTEWHSFSVASSHLTDQLLFIVSINGDWTNKLKEKLKHKSNDTAIILGPFYTTSTEILNDESENILCIAGGVGIAPFISVVDTKVQLSKINDEYRSNYLDTNEEKMTQKQSLSITDLILDLEKSTYSRQSKKELTVVWLVREPQHLSKYIDDIINLSDKIHFSIYVTSSKNIKDKWFMLKMLEQSSIECYFIKPNMNKLIKSKYDKVFFCGPERLENDVKDICHHKNKPLYCEYFD